MFSKLPRSLARLQNAIFPCRVLPRQSVRRRRSWRCLEDLEARTLLSPPTYTVTNASDSGVGSLRQAILDTNANVDINNADTIQFAIASGPQAIHLLSALPSITDPVIIDATTQPGYNGIPIIQLNNGYLSGDGLTLLTGNSTIRGLVINRFIGNGIRISGTGASGNVIEGNYIGTNPLGTGELHNTANGILIENGAANNRIGTNGDGINDAAERNLISGNQRSGIELTGLGTTTNLISGNYIGTNAAGSTAIPNGVVGSENLSGILRRNGASNNVIGVSPTGSHSAAERNVISGNAFYGIFIAEAATNNNIVAGNYIGTKANGTPALGNGVHGVIMAEATKNNLIGTDANGIWDDIERNIISGNGSAGVRMRDFGTTGNIVAGNYIGTDVTGEIALGNAVYGVSISLGASNNLIGTNGAGFHDSAERNVISGNNWDGIGISGIGTDANAEPRVSSGKISTTMERSILAKKQLKECWSPWTALMTAGLSFIRQCSLTSRESWNSSAYAQATTRSLKPNRSVIQTGRTCGER